MFEILKMLRDINTLRRLTWHVQAAEEPGRPHHIVVEIPIDDDDLELVNDMQALFAPHN